MFVVSEDASLVPFSVRRQLVAEGCADLSNVVCHETGPYMISNATFPSYFLKDSDTVIRSHAKLDIQVFLRIAKALSVTDRFVGEEPFSQVTGIYNQVMAEELKLSNAEIKVMQQGEPLTFVMQDEPVTVGISLHEKDGIRFCQGDAKKWSEQTKREWDKYTFGCYGCWMMDDDGNLDYIPEEQYTEELWNEQKKSAQRNMGAGLHK